MKGSGFVQLKGSRFVRRINKILQWGVEMGPDGWRAGVGAARRNKDTCAARYRDDGRAGGTARRQVGVVVGNSVRVPPGQNRQQRARRRGGWGRDTARRR